MDEPTQKSMQELISDSQHVNEVLRLLGIKFHEASFEEAEVDLHAKIDRVPDLTKMSDKKDTVAMLMRLRLKPKKDRPTADNVLAEIEKINNRFTLMGGMLSNRSFPVTFTKKVTENESTEYFKLYDEQATVAVADAIWRFLLYGIQPT